MRKGAMGWGKYGEPECSSVWCVKDKREEIGAAGVQAGHVAVHA